MGPSDIITIIYNAFTAHINDLHGADFEVCDHPDCVAAYALEVEHNPYEGMNAEEVQP